MRSRKDRKGALVICLFLFALNGLNAGESVWKLRISVDKANIRLEPDAESPVASSALKGTTLDSYEKVGEWFRVVIGPDEKGFLVIGYIHSSDVEIIEEKMTTEPDFWMGESEFFQGIGLHIKLSGAQNYFGAGDIDKGTGGFFDSMVDFVSTTGYTLEKVPAPFHTASDISGDIIFYIKPRLGIGLGVSYIYARKANTIRVYGERKIIWKYQIDSHPKISAVPIRLGLFFTHPIHRLFSVSLSGGLSLYLTKYLFSLSSEWDDVKNVYQNANAKGLGFQGGIGFEINLNPRAVLFIESQGRYAKISNFKGGQIDRKRVHSEYVYSEEKGTLYYMEDEKYSYLAIYKDEPSGLKTVRKATFDFSGFSLRAGLIFKF